ncbi:L,D-transpeptidase catalytic domain [Flavobacterium fluvii]|uniref:L,D-transpeptidase catalytic domain n=1 Tax=Flavobacterium fluvii TaxID=468056 RepID=A0A1M5KJ42_9FLAO|nr:L,D-transpeptidase family protein [Flavobacterium fluvii]SHG52499.1 L,D-transpeptidase catalytic domain [Flavobacterium fluvii]
MYCISNSFSIFKTGFNSKIILVWLVVMQLTLGCNNKKGNVGFESGIYTAQNYSDLVLDETELDNYFKAFPESDTIKKEVYQFYENREYQFAWFNKKGMTIAVPILYNKIRNFSVDFDNNSLINTRLDSLIALTTTDAKPSLARENRKKELELLLTTTFFKYSKKVYGGIVKNPHELDWYIPRKKKNYQALLDSLVVLNKGENISEPVNQYYIRLKTKLREYRKIAKKGGFPKIVTTKTVLSITENDSCLLAVKQHLFLTGDLATNDKTIVFTNQLAKAVSSFQHRMGLVENGKINAPTLVELNQSVDFRIKQMMINLERLRWVPVEMEKEYLLVNIPEYKLHVIEDDKLVWTTNVVVGKDVNPSTIFTGNISRIMLNPYWNIPNSIIRNEIIPNIKKNSNYLEENNMEVLSGDKVVNSSTIDWYKYKGDVPFIIRQKPGGENALGKMKFLFPNNYNIYLHDTPSKGLFKASKRAFSHGCIRVENPNKLLMYLLRKDKNWNQERVDTILKTNKEYGIQIKPTVPVYIVYFTSWVDSKGQLNFRNDIYDLDQQLSNEIFGE